MDPAGRRSSQPDGVGSLRCWFGSSNRSPWKEHPFCTNRMVSDRRGTTLFLSGELNGVSIALVARTVVRSDDWMSQLLTQLESQHEVSGDNGSSRGRDDESGVD
ncbi:hypothetical protein Tco_0007870 [Tanacetum coccineum]